MPRTVLRQFTGGISNEIDPQNLREDQGEEAVDINLKGFALEPGEGLDTLTESGHYYYRGEWIKDSEAVSFEESGVGVIKTYDSKRPQFEEIINDKDNIARDLGPSLPPGAAVTGTVASEGTRGERPADGAHLLTLPSSKLGAVDTAETITDAPSLREHKATATKDLSHVHYYQGFIYWVEKSGSTWNVKTRAYVNNAFTSNPVLSGNLTHNSGGSFFKDGYFVCWDERYIDTVPLSVSSMNVSTLDTIDSSNNGNAGSNFGHTTGATAREISSVDICGTTVTFTQKIETADSSITKYANSDDERWIMPRKTASFILLLRDGLAYQDENYSGSIYSNNQLINAPKAESSGAWNAGSDDVQVLTSLEPTVENETWIEPYASLGHSIWSGREGAGNAKVGLKYIVKYLPAGEWACVRQVGTNKAEILVIEHPDTTLSSISASDVDHVNVTVSAEWDHIRNFKLRKGDGNQRKNYNTDLWRLKTRYKMEFPRFAGAIEWEGHPIADTVYRDMDASDPDNDGEADSFFEYATHISGGGMGWGSQKRELSNDSWRNMTMKVPLGKPSGSTREEFSRTIDLKPIQNIVFFWQTGGASASSNPIPNPISWVGNRIVENKTTVPTEYDKEGSTTRSFKNTSVRLCSYTPGSAVSLQKNAGQSSIYTVATISGSEKSIAFTEANDTNFRVGDYIRVGGDSDVNSRRISLNLPEHRLQNKVRGRRYFIARIKSIETGKLHLEEAAGFENRFMNGVDELCYPIITTIDVDWKEEDTNEATVPTQERKLIRTALTSNTLLGSSHGRRWGHVGDNQLIEVRDTSGDDSNSPYNTRVAAHKIDWQDRTIRSVNTSGSALRIIYMANNLLYSQNGLGSNVPPTTKEFSDKGTVHLTSTLMTVVNKGVITVYDPNMNTQFVKGKPKKPTGLGLTGTITDGFHVSNSYGTFVFAKSRHSGGEYWRMVRTGTTPETTLLSYDFVTILSYDGNPNTNADKIWGTFKDDSDNYDIRTAVPFFESNIAGSWINYSSNSNAVSAWGQVLKSRLSKADKDSNTKRWLSVDWKYDSGVYNSTGDPTIGLAHETGKMLGANNEFTWYLKDQIEQYQTAGLGSVISEPTVAIKFSSKVTRDVVFFQSSDFDVVPASGQTGGENQVAFVNYAVAGQKFYVLNDNIISLKGEDPDERGYQLSQTSVGGDLFDASRVGRSTFLVGAPNMHNPYGPNIDFYYRASFIDKWNNESVPSPLAIKGIAPLDSPDDCIQLSFSPEFFRLDNEDITKIRLYRYGGDSAEFMFLADIPIPKISSFPLAVPSTGGFAATLNRKATLSPFYELKTYHDISELGDLTNSTFDLTATPNDIDGSWRVNQVNENEPRKGFTATNDSGNLRINSEDHGLSNNNIVRVSSTETLPGNLSYEDYYYVVNKADDYFQLSGSTGGTPITWSNTGSGTHTWRMIGYEGKLKEDLNKTDTTVKLISSSFPSAWPSSGVVKIGTEYISYTGKSGNDLTGCVRGTHGTDASEHQMGRLSGITVTGGGTNFGYNDNTSGYKTGTFSASTDQSADTWLQFNLTSHGLPANGAPFIFKTTGTLPNSLQPNTVYYTSSIATNSFLIATSSGGNPLTHTSDFGSGTHSINGCIIIPDSARTKTFTPSTGSSMEINTTGHGLSQNNLVTLAVGKHQQEDLGRKLIGSNSSSQLLLTADNGFGTPTAHELLVGEKIRFTRGQNGWGTNPGRLAVNDGELVVSNPPNFTSWSGSYFNSGENIQISTSGSGSGAVFTVTVDSSGVPTGCEIRFQDGTYQVGQGYAIGDTITVKEAIGNDTATFTVDAIGPTLPTGVNSNTDYFVSSTGFTTNTFKVATSTSGTPISYTDSGSGNFNYGTLGELPTGLAVNTNYYMEPVSGGNANKFYLKGTSNGATIPFTDVGSGAFTWTDAQGGGTGAIATYEVNSSGVITSGTIANAGTGYSSSPNFAQVYDPGSTTAGSGDNISFNFFQGDLVNPVEWNLEMEHRNQDTTTLETAIETNAVPATIYVADTSVFPASGSILIGNQIIDYTGKSTDGLSFTTCSHNAGGGIQTTHSVGVLVSSMESPYTVTSLSDVSLELNAVGYRDKARTPVASLHSIKEDNWPPLALTYNEEKKQFFETEADDDFFRYITAVGSMYFGAVDADLRFSTYASPENWPLEAVVTLDSEIKGIMEHAGEGIVFTTNSVYRVRGTDPKTMVAFRVPDARGIKDGDRHTIAEFNGGIIWKTASDGICVYSGGKVNYITRDKHNIPDMDLPTACVSDGVYWLFQRPRATREAGDTGNGFRLEITSGDLRVCQTSIQAYHAYFAKALGKAVVVTSDNSLSANDTSFVVKEIGGNKASTISWKSKKIDAGDPAVAKAFGSIAIVYESLDSLSSPTLLNGIRGERLATNLLGIGANDLDAGDLNTSALDGASDLYDIFTKYDEDNQEFIADIGGTNWNSTQRSTILMPVGFDTTSVTVGDAIWHEYLDDNTKVSSVGTETVGGVAYPTIVLDKEPLRSGSGNLVWGKLPIVHVYINNESTPARSFVLPPVVSNEPQSADLYLTDLRRFRTISVKVEGNVRVNTLSLRHYPIQQYQTQTLHHSADIFYKGVVDFRVKLDGDLIYRKELANAGDEFTEERIYLPASSYGTRVHYMNESRNGMIESVKFNGSLAA